MRGKVVLVNKSKESWLTFCRGLGGVDRRVMIQYLNSIHCHSGSRTALGNKDNMLKRTNYHDLHGFLS